MTIQTPDLNVLTPAALLGILVLLLILLCAALIKLSKLSKRTAGKQELTELVDRSFEAQNRLIDRGNTATQTILDMQADRETAGFSQLQQSLNAQLERMSSEILNLRSSQERQLREIKNTVDEQLQESLDKKIKDSFDSVSRQLAEVQKGLGEMSALALSVGDLKKTLSSTKTRGILGEAQLGAILEQLLAPSQYETNVCTVKGSNNPVEFAVKLPGDGDEPVYLPIDAKFPLETYQALLDAYDSADQAKIAAAKKNLEQRILSEAKDIREKYIHVPETTDFGILFLPVEGMYAEVVRLGLIEKLQTRYRINIAGPTTISAFLNSLQMGFRTLAIQQRSAEVWQLLGNVKTEFAKFAKALEDTQGKITQAGSELEKLVGVRTRQMNRQLSAIDSGQLTVGNELQASSCKLQGDETRGEGLAASSEGRNFCSAKTILIRGEQ